MLILPKEKNKPKVNNPRFLILFGRPKSGKTTTATRFPKSLLLAFEKGYSAIPGVRALPINSWSEFKKVLRLLAEII